MEFGGSLLLRDTGRGGTRPSTSIARGERLCLQSSVPPNEGRASKPSGFGGTRSTASDGGTPSTASPGWGGTGPSMESLPSGRGGTRPSHGMLSPRVEAGAFGDRAGAGRCARGVVVRQGGDLGEHWQRRDDPSAHRRKEGWAVGRRRRAAGRIGVHSSEAASWGPRPGRKVREVGRLSGATSPGPCCSRQPPRQGV